MSLILAIALGATGPAGNPLLSEDQAIDIVARAMRPIDPLPTRCLSFVTEETTAKSFEIAVGENHNKGCGGDPRLLTFVERFRVDRSSHEIWILEPDGETYRLCPASKAGQPRCPQD